MNDLDSMPFGIHKGIPMQDVPAGYLHWLWTKRGMKRDKHCAVAGYIRKRLNHLKIEYPDGIW